MPRVNHERKENVNSLFCTLINDLPGSVYEARVERIAGLVTRSSVTLFASSEERRRIRGRASDEPDPVAEGEVALNASDHSKILHGEG
jgi:hypothetical protein